MVEVENTIQVAQLFEQFSRMNVLIIGDVMIDSYMFGKVERISPEAPVPIVSVTHKDDRLGGAANVALNICALGAKPFLCSVIGNDVQGDKFTKLMNNLALSTSGIIRSDSRLTTVKTRVIGNKHQLLRVDEEQLNDISESESEALLKKIKTIASTEKIDVIIVEDYDKGVMNAGFIEEIILFSKQAVIPVVVDPKKKNFSLYKDVALFKPNLNELKSGLKTDIDRVSVEVLDKTAGEYRKKHGIGKIMVTLSESGVYIADDESSIIIPAHYRNISDVSGAGDTVISVAALCLSAGISSSWIARMANLAGGLVCEKLGVVSLDKDQFKAEALLLSSN